MREFAKFSVFADFWTVKVENFRKNRKNCKNWTFTLHFPIPPLTFHIIKLQPLGVERQMNPFWKLERWGNHMGKLEGNLKF